jgi:ABC-2 type transport system ATP-binding protein
VEIRNLIRRLAEHSTILFSTHILSEVEALCDRVIILMNGQIRADARLSELARGADVRLVLQAPVDGVATALSQLEGVTGVRSEWASGHFPAYRVLAESDGVTEGDLGPSIYNLARQREWPVRELRRDARTLETIFNELATTEEPVNAE